MDLSKVMVFFLTHLIALDFNLAESGDSDAAPQDVAASDETTTPYIPDRFKWASKGAPSVVSEIERVSVDTDDEDLDPQSRAVYWIPTTCDSLFERGYTCVGCGESLHCMAGNFALKAICYGRRPYCNNGVCSYIPGNKCQNMGQVSHIANQTIQPVQETHIADPSNPAIQADGMQGNVTIIADEIEHTIPTNIAGGIKN